VLNQVSPVARVLGSLAVPLSKLRPASAAEALKVCLPASGVGIGLVVVDQLLVGESVANCANE